MALETSSAVVVPQEALLLDEVALHQYLSSAIEGFPIHKDLHIRQFAHGQSNPTYLLQAGESRYVLRKKPPGRILASAHAVDREYSVLQALKKTAVPVPAARALCTDDSVLGTPFYVMDHVQGDIFVDPAMPSASAQERQAAYTAMATTLATLHKVDFRAVGLQGFGRHTGYCSRQVWRWRRQYAAQLQGEALPEMQHLIHWLENHIPESDSDPRTTCISHGDYRLDNLVLDGKDRGNILAILDWELSTLGHPTADLAYSAMPYYLPLTSDDTGLPALPRNLPEGILTEKEYIQAYCKARGVPLPDANTYSFCMALSLFRIAAIVAGVGARALMGNASSTRAAEVGSESFVKLLAQRALHLIAKCGSVPTRSLQQTESLLARMSSPSPEISTSRDEKIPAGPGFLPPKYVAQLVTKIRKFMDSHILPAEPELEELANSDKRWTIHPTMEKLKKMAQEQGLWNCWISDDLASCFKHLMPQNPKGVDRYLLGHGLSNLEYAYLSETMGRVPWASEVFNCSAPDTGNMEVLGRYGTGEQQRRWLLPLLRGEIRSCFAMTEPSVASSDATNIQSSITRDGNSYLLNGHKWWASGAPDPRCSICIFMGKSDPSAASYKQQSMILVPMSTPGVDVIRPLPVFGYDDAPHGHAEVLFKDVRVPLTNMLLGEGRGFEIAQGRLGPGRLHHCMRLIGMGERAMELMGGRALDRQAFGKPISQHGAFALAFANCRVELSAARLTVLDAASALDRFGNKKARDKIAAAKVLAPRAVLSVLDQAIQVHGGAGVSNDFPLARLWAGARTLRLADGPDEVHLLSIAKSELARLAEPSPKL